MRDILTRAAVMGHAQLAAQSFADRRPDRVVWPGTQWEWAVLRPENGTFDTPDYADVYARQKWFYQAQIESPAMFARAPGAGSLYWLNTRDGPAPTSTAASPTPSTCPSRSRRSCSGRSPSTTPAPAARSAPNRTGPRSGPCSSSPATRPTSRSGCTSGPSRPPAGQTTAPGFRPCPASAGSCTSGSTAPRPGVRRHLAAAGLPGQLAE